MAENQVDTVSVGIEGDSTDLVKSLEDAEKATREAADEVEKAASKVEAIAEKMKAFAAAAATALTTIQTAANFSELINAFAESEAGEAKLRGALALNGREVGKLSKEYGEFAERLSEVTVVSKDQALTLLRQAENMGVTGEAAKRAVQNSIALAAATDQTADAALAATVALEKGETEAIKELIPNLKNLEDEQLVVNEALKDLDALFEAAGAETETTTGKITKMTQGFDDLKESFGAILADGIGPLIEIVKDAVDWFKGLSDATKTAILLIPILAAGVLALGTAFLFAGTIFNTMFSGIGILLGVLITGMTTAAVAAGGFVASVGGIAAAMGQIKKAALDAWEWLAPTRKALAFLGETIYTNVVLNFNRLKDAATSAWTAIFGESETTWDDVQDQALEAIIAIEFGLNNFSRLMELVWTKAKLGVATFAGQAQYQFGTVIPTLLQYVRDNWMAIFEDIFRFGMLAVKNYVNNTVTSLKSIPALVAGTMTFEDLGRKLMEQTEPFKTSLAELPKIPAREIGAYESNLRDQMNELAQSLGDDFNEFRSERLNAIAADDIVPDSEADKAEQKAGDVAAQVAEEANENLAEIGDVDAVEAGSAEALARIEDFRQKLMDAKDEYEGGDKDASPAANTTITQIGGSTSTGAGTKNDQQLLLLKEIRDLIREQNKLRTITLDGADL